MCSAAGVKAKVLAKPCAASIKASPCPERLAIPPHTALAQALTTPSSPRGLARTSLAAWSGAGSVGEGRESAAEGC